jgi:hypothetical protein
MRNATNEEKKTRKGDEKKTLLYRRYGDGQQL